MTMQTIESIFSNRSYDATKLVKYGFVEKDDAYLYSTLLTDNMFEIRVVVYKNGRINADVFDYESKEIYALVNVPDATGAFIGKIRSECEIILREISEKCFYNSVFKSESAKALINYIKNEYHDELEFLWPKFSDNAVWRRQDNKKWYAVLLKISKRKLGLESDEVVEIIDLRMAPERLEATLDGKKYFPGYHMNKKHWLTICLNGSVSVSEICKLIDDSYLIAKHKS